MNPRTDRQTRQAATVIIDDAPTIGSEIGSTDNYSRIEIIKGPVMKDKLFIRLSGRKNSTGGEYVNAGDPNSRLGAEFTTAGGLSLFFTPSRR
jgi:hypothetical protein